MCFFNFSFKNQNYRLPLPSLKRSVGECPLDYNIKEYVFFLLKEMTGFILFLRIPSHILGRFSTIFLGVMGAAARNFKKSIIQIWFLCNKCENGGFPNRQTNIITEHIRFLNRLFYRDDKNRILNDFNLRWALETTGIRQSTMMINKTFLFEIKFLK